MLPQVPLYCHRRGEDAALVQQLLSSLQASFNISDIKASCSAACKRVMEAHPWQSSADFQITGLDAIVEIQELAKASHKNEHE